MIGVDVVDAHVHVGLDKYRPVGDLLADMDEVGVRRAVLVQHIGQFDNAYLVDVCAPFSGSVRRDRRDRPGRPARP